MTLADFPPWFLRAFALCFGLLWGSFLNVVIHRVPRELSVVRPGSRCPACGTPIRAYDNIPVLSYLLLRGRARCCGAPVSPRYPLVEAVGGVLSLAIVELIILRLPWSTPILHALATYTADLALALGLVAATFIDLEHMYIPDGITIGGAVLGVATASLRSMGFTDALLGAAVGFAVVWLPFVVIYPRLRGGRVGMGLGDAKLLMLAGAWFGWGGALFVLGAGAVQGSIVAIALLLLRGSIEEPEAVRLEREQIRAELAGMSPEERAAAEKELAQDPLAEEPGEGFGQARIAFGPFLALATLECLLVGRDILEAYFSWIDAG
ncbi:MULTISPECIES: prepilin peptidase [unclassified Sorangium]|uniref:Prepilin leader peptidase/N-methyltransferase n=1 Tax=Sorangium cellulosum TaxID=56 RepID=A0A150T750_SORCE|nr:prepilin peptidase [Sorangium cellulosum]KYG00464.1 prepilin peptidase [Sorangium cellulosum]